MQNAAQWVLSVVAVLLLTSSSFAQEVVRGHVPRGNGVAQKKVYSQDGRWGVWSPGAGRIVAVGSRVTSKTGAEHVPTGSGDQVIVVDTDGRWGRYSKKEKRFVGIGSKPFSVAFPRLAHDLPQPVAPEVQQQPAAPAPPHAPVPAT